MAQPNQRVGNKGKPPAGDPIKFDPLIPPDLSHTIRALGRDVP
jgi:hypothetical protein